MKKGIWAILSLAVMDLILAVMHHFGYYFLFLKPTGYLIPLVMNISVLAVIGFRSTRLHRGWSVALILFSLPIVLFYSLLIWFGEYSYERIQSPSGKQALFIQYRDFTLGETTYSYTFYQTKYGLIGRLLDDQSISLIVRAERVPGQGAEEALGMDHADWLTDTLVRFSTWKGMRDVYLAPHASKEKKAADIEAFMEEAANEKRGKSIVVYGNRLEVEVDQASGESWIEVDSPQDNGPIPRQQCSRMIRDEEQGYYMLEECTHKWEYPLYPLLK